MTKSIITREPITHDLKIYPEFFSAVSTGVKRAELRKNDRDYRVGDTLHLMETPRGSCHQTGEFINVKITHIVDVGEWMPGYVLLSVELQESRKADSEPVAWTWQHLKQWHVTNDEERVRDLAWDGVKVEPLYRHAQPAPVVPDDVRQALSKMDDEIIAELDAEESVCRAAMLQAGNSPAQSDCCPAQNVVSPAQSPIDHGYLPEYECSGCKATARICTEIAVNSLVIPNEMTSEQAYEIGYYYGDPVDVFARGANWMRQHIIDSTLAAAPQLPGSEPATVPGKWIPVSERLPEDSGRYWCYVEEQNDLGKSHYQWNCSWNGDRWWVESEGGGIVTHWMPLPAAPEEVKGE